MITENDFQIIRKNALQTLEAMKQGVLHQDCAECIRWNKLDSDIVVCPEHAPINVEVFEYKGDK